jgi:hypothetical protein
MAIRTALGQSRWTFPVVATNRNTSVTGDAATDVFTVSTAHNMIVGDRVVFATLVGGTGLTAGTVYTVATVPLTTTFTLTGVNITANLTAGSVVCLPQKTETTVYAPESAKTWVCADVTYTADDNAAVPQAITRRTLRLGIDNGATTEAANNAVITSTGEQISFVFSASFQARFATSWTSGLAKSVQLYHTAMSASPGVSAGFGNNCATLRLLYTYQVGDTTITGVASTDVITTAVTHNLAVGDYVYVDGLTGGSGLTAGTYTVATVPTATTLTLTGVDFTTDISAGTLHFSPVRIKSVPMQLTTTATNLQNSKPGSPNHTIPVLSTEDSGECPERGKTFREYSIELLANTDYNGSTDHTWSMEIGTAGALTSSLYEAANTTSRLIRYTTSPSFLSGMNPAITNGWFIWASIASTFFHPTATLWITYEYSAKTSTRMRVDQLVANNPQNAMSGSSTPPVTSLGVEVWVPEAGTITTLQLALRWTWQPTAIIGSMNARIGTGSYTNFTDGGGVYAGGNIAGVRTDAAYALSRGRNMLTSGHYRTSGDPGLGLTGMWIISYSCDVPAAGVEYATKSILKGLDQQNMTATAVFLDFLALAPASMPESTTWRLTNLGFIVTAQSSTVGIFDALYMSVTAVANDIAPRTAGQWLAASDDEAGWNIIHFSTDRLVWPWAAFIGGAPLDKNSPSDPTTTHNGYVLCSQRATSITFVGSIDSLYTYHSLAITVNAVVKGSSGATVEVSLHRGHNRTVTGLTGNAGTDVFTTPTPHWLTVGVSVTITALTGGLGLALGTYIVGTVPSPTTFTLTGGLFTTNITAGTIELPLPRGGEQLAQVSRVGDGAVSLTWYDNTEPVFLVADDMGNAARKTMSVPFLADPNVTHTLRMLNPPRVVDATIVRKGGS